VIFSGIGVLVSAAKGVSDSEGKLADLFERIEGFFRRLEAYIDVSSNAGMTDTIVKIMVEVLLILGIVTKEIKRNKAKKFLRRLAGRTDLDDALQKLERLTQEEVRMATAQDLRATHGVAHAVAGISREVQGVGDQVISGVEIIAKEVADLNRSSSLSYSSFAYYTFLHRGSATRTHSNLAISTRSFHKSQHCQRFPP